MEPSQEKKSASKNSDGVSNLQMQQTQSRIGEEMKQEVMYQDALTVENGLSALAVLTQRKLQKKIKRLFSKKKKNRIQSVNCRWMDR